jgi:hypothetical protein
MKMRSLVGALLSLAVMAGTAFAQMAQKGADVEPPPLEKVLASAKTPNNAQLAELMAIKPELPLGPTDVLKEYEHGMALIAQGMSADVVNISRAQEANQVTREQECASRAPGTLPLADRKVHVYSQPYGSARR